MNMKEKLTASVETVRTTAEAIGKFLWVFFGAFIAVAIASGNEILLNTIRDRLVAAGFTTVTTPLGPIDVARIGKSEVAAHILGISAADAAELAAGAQDEASRKKLEKIAEDLNKQQTVLAEAQRDTLRRIERNAPAAAAGEAGEGWVYLGRHSGERWRPPSLSVVAPSYPVKPGQRLEIKADTVLYNAVDCRTIDLGEFKADPASAGLSFVTPGPVKIEIVDEPVLCNSIGGAKTVWAKVRVPGTRLLRAAR